jgi:predicted transglutaminase-like cysteine proteinase
MRRTFAVIVAQGVLAILSAWQGAEAAFFGFSRGVVVHQQHQLRLDVPALAPFGHTRFCLQHPEECTRTMRRVTFRGGDIRLTPARWADLLAVNADVNFSIAPERNMGGILTEKWVLSPQSGDCNDYAVTKRHALLARGWPSRSLLLAEVVTKWGEHHLVLVVRIRDGDLVLDNIDASIRPWKQTGYRWVRIQTPQDPRLWASVSVNDGIVALAGAKAGAN